MLQKILSFVYRKNDKQNILTKLSRCFTKYVFLKIPQHIQENTCAGVFYNKFTGFQPAT